MRRNRLFLATLLGSSALVGATSPSTAVPEPADLGLPPSEIFAARVPFIENHGQVPETEVRFFASTVIGNLFVTREGGLVYDLPVSDGGRGRASWAFRESFLHAQPARVEGKSASATRVSYFKGSDPDRWLSALSTYDSIVLGELYPDIRVELEARSNGIEKLFYVAPGGDVDRISMEIEGVDRIEISDTEQLILQTSHGEAAFTAPVAYQTIEGQRRPVEVAYVLAGSRRYGFRVGAYDRREELVIDPMLASTFLGGQNPSPPGNYDDDIIWGMVTAGGDVFVGGATQSPDFPVRLGYDDTLDSSYPDGFVARLSGDLSTVVAATFIGTDGFDRVTDISLDAAGSIVAVGQAGWGFPVTDGAFNWQGSTPVGGGFVARFNPELSVLIDSSVPTPVDYPRALAIGNGGIYFGGTTNYPEFPITDDAYRSTCCPMGSFGIREYDGFAGKLSLDLSTLEAMTYLGGNTVTAMDVAPDGSVFITDGFDYAISGSLARFDAGLTSRPAYLNYHGQSNSGSTRTYFNDVVAADGYVVAVGQTYMNDLPATEGAFDTTCGTDGLCDGQGELLVPRSDGFVGIYGYDLGDPIALTYFGGSYHESIRSVALSADGGIHVVGETTSIDFPTAGNDVDTSCGIDGLCDADDPFSPRADGFVARLSADLSGLEFGTYLGGSLEDRPTVVAVDAVGLVWAAGFTDSSDFPTTEEAFDRTYNGGTSDAFLSLFDTEMGGGGAMIFVDDFELGDMSGWSSYEP